MTRAIPDPRDRAARIAVSTLFFANGAITASILPRLPAIKDGLGLSNAELGAAVAAMPVGGLLAGGLVGFLIARYGSGRVATTAGVGAATMLVFVGLSASWATLALSYLVLGMFDATMDASMNSHGLGVQRQYGRSILQGFHGMWSVGSVAGGVVGAVAAGAGVPVAAQLACSAVVLVVAVLAAGRRLLPASRADAPHDADNADAKPIHLRNAPRLLRVLVPIAMLGILCVFVQGSAATWSAIYVADVLDQPAGIAATAFVVYMGAMVIGRLTNDRWIDRWGSTAVVRLGAVIAGTGMALVIVAAPLGMAAPAFIGFAAVGLGSSPMFPVMIGAAGSRPGIPAGHGVAMTTWLVRFGMIVAPALVGAVADAQGLAIAFLLPLAAAVAIAALSPVLTGARGQPLVALADLPAA